MEDAKNVAIEAAEDPYSDLFAALDQKICADRLRASAGQNIPMPGMRPSVEEAEIPLCQYVKTGGKRCGSPALRDYRFCYYHVGQLEAMPMTTMFLQENHYLPPNEPPISGFQLPFLDDAAAIQIGFMQLIHGVAHFRLDPRRAGLILSALHGASANLKHMDAAIGSATSSSQKTAGKDGKDGEVAGAAGAEKKPSSCVEVADAGRQSA